MKQLFPHQKEMVLATSKNSKGIVQSPTGSGKTLAQAQIATDEILKGGFRIILTKTPRISLTNQVAKEYVEFMNDRGISEEKVVSFLVHSGESADFSIDEDLSEDEKLTLWDSLPQTIQALTITKDIKSRIKRAQKLNLPVLIFTTYHSNPKVLEILKRTKIGVDLDINDEGHYLTGEDFGKILSMVTPKRQYFFTATLKTAESSGGKGMDNKNKFGEIIYNMSVSEAVSRKIILALKAGVLKSSVPKLTQEEVDFEIGEMIKKAYDILEGKFPKLGAKMIVSSKGARQIEIFLGSPEFSQMVSRGINILTVHSRKGLTTHNGIEINRARFNELKDQIGGDLQSKMIIVHYDILSEGIDIQGLQGALILRKMTRSKFYQNVGRVIRILRGNESLKRHGFLMFPDIVDPDMRLAFMKFFMELKEDGYLPKEFFTDFNPMGEKEEEDDFDGRQGEESKTFSHDLDLMLRNERVEKLFSEMTEEERLDLLRSSW